METAAAQGVTEGATARRCTSLTLMQKLEKLIVWEANPEWGPTRAARELSVSRGALSRWKEEYPDPSRVKNDSTLGDGARKRAVGGGRKRKPPAFETRVLEYYDTCLREDGKATYHDVFTYCSTIPEFLLKDLGAQKVYVTRFIKRYKSSPAALSEQETTCGSRATELFKPHTDTSDELTLRGIQPCVPDESNELVSSGAISDGGRLPLSISDQNSDIPFPLATAKSKTTKPSSSIAQRTRNDVGDTATGTPPGNNNGEGTVNLDGERGDCKTGHDDEEDPTSDDDKYDEVEEEDDEADDDYNDDPEPDESDDDGPFADDHDEELEVDYARQNQHTKTVTGSKPIASRRQRDLLAKRSRAVFSFTVRNLDTSMLGEERSVKVFKDDIMTLKPFGWLADVVIDYAIYKRIKLTGGSVKLLGASLFSQINQAKCGGESRFLDVKKLVDKIDWDLYFAVLIPVWGDNHWSLLVVEEPAKPSRRMFHVDSCVGIHVSSHVLSIATQFLAEVCGVASDGSATTSVCETHPQQKKQLRLWGPHVVLHGEDRFVYHAKQEQIDPKRDKKLTSGMITGRSDKFRIKMHQTLSNLTGTNN
ncbi:hypothetical protein GN958_ATG02739 [Phytophthora infestans]|uniref:Ubiquitin-like protease family profile domain-containing protein n=1 Tax=Phytophthora infestans TaxID=4787 RepID=A0A8S9V4F8_PHYIN|nr:hypothetical protein GN958_ATG02739 [Phytophthora infestans]